MYFVTLVLFKIDAMHFLKSSLFPRTASRPKRFQSKGL